jgi:hypothetical protein
METNPAHNAELLERIVKDAALRRALTRQRHGWFFHVFLSSYIEYPVALFHEEMFALTEDETQKLVAVIAFRGSGKSTIMNLSYSLWAILGVQQKKHVVIVSKTQAQAKTHFANIKRELEHNELLAADLGPFKTDEDVWGTHTITLANFDAKIVAVSRDQSIRGMRHGAHRPDLIILDDIEDSASVILESERASTYSWFQNEVMLAGSAKTKIILLGNLLSELSLIMRVKETIEKGRMPGAFRAYPLLDDNNRILWPGKFPSMEAVQELKRQFDNRATWSSEFLLVMESPTASSIPLMWNYPRRDREYPRQKFTWEHEPRRFGRYTISAPLVFGQGVPIGGNPFIKPDPDFDEK